MDTDGNGHHYRGDNRVINPQGRVIATAEPRQATCIDAGLSSSAPHEYHEKFPVWQDADPFTLQLSPSLPLHNVFRGGIVSFRDQPQNKSAWRYVADIVSRKG